MCEERETYFFLLLVLLHLRARDGSDKDTGCESYGPDAALDLVVP